MFNIKNIKYNRYNNMNKELRQLIYDFGSETEVLKYLRRNLPPNSIMQIAKSVKLNKFAKENDMVLFYGWGAGYIKCKKALIERGVKIFPDGELSLWLGDKIRQSKYIDTITKFPLDRIYIENESNALNSYKTPALGENPLMVVKIGNSHQGLKKYLKEENSKVITKENVIFEEFVEDARSIRILMIENNVYIVEHEDIGWIKNANPQESTYTYADRYKLNISNIDKIIRDAKAIQADLKIDYCGLDYVVGKHKAGLLEINDMIGLPDNDEVYNNAKSYWLKVCLAHLGDQQ